MSMSDGNELNILRVGYDAQRHLLEKAEAQRADLLEALHEIAAIGHDDTERPDHAVVRAMIVGMARDAVSKVEG